MNVTQALRAISHARESAQCNAGDDESPPVVLSLDDAVNVIKCLEKLETVLIVLGRGGEA